MHTENLHLHTAEILQNLYEEYGHAIPNMIFVSPSTVCMAVRESIWLLFVRKHVLQIKAQPTGLTDVNGLAIRLVCVQHFQQHFCR